MDLSELMSSYKISPEAEERFSRSILEHIRGSVRINPGAYVMPGILLMILGGIIMSYCTVHSGIFAMLLIIGYCLMTFLIFWYMLTWRIDFDAESGFVHYHTFFGGTKTYHVNELMGFELQTGRFEVPTIMTGVVRLQRYAELFRARPSVLAHEMLKIHTEEGTIVIPVSSALLQTKLMRGVGGYTDGEKLYTYLDLYRRYVVRNQPDVDEQAGNAGLSAGTLAAIEEQKREQESAFQFAPEAGSEIPELGAGEHATEPEAHFVSAEMADISEPEKPVMTPEKPAEIPEKPAMTPEQPEKPEAPAAAAMEEKPYVDVDALFNDVLKRYGKDDRRRKR